MMILMLMLTMTAGQDDPAIARTRTEQLTQARLQKAESIEAPKRSFLENGLYQVKEHRILERFQEGFHGFRPLLGGMVTGSGFAAGTSFERGGVRASVQASLKGYLKYDLEYRIPNLDERIFADLRATHRNYPQEDFYGSGMDSRDEDRADYRLEDTNFTGRLGFKPVKYASAGVLAGWLESKIGPGTDPHFPSFEGVSGTDHFYAGAFVDIDYRDNAGNPRAGGRYTAQWTTHQDQKLGLYDFSRYDIEVQQYLPFFNQRRVIALRGRTTLTHSGDGQQIPFYMQPTLGGSEDLRGFSELRFRDNNMVVLNAEYRWEAFSGLDLALFADAGQVAGKARDIDFTDLQTSYGFGFRFNTSKSVFLRADFGFSSEGSRVFLKFGHVF